ncbi:MAG: DUF1993 family protein [Pelagimonas sp.]|uniref:DUF1993 family protein n=1 Tax=Pelagimonas sp. TaxID=2073170 RepID=UPI003D6BEDBB
MTRGLVEHYLPVFRHFLNQIDHLVMRADTGQLAARLAPDSLSALENFATAQGYVLRSLCPLVGKDVPQLDDVTTAQGLRARGDFVRKTLETLARTDAQIVGDIHHVAGKATLSQAPYDYIALYGAPNFFFHMNMGYAILRSMGLDVGKGDFDGFHIYPPGFSFVTAKDTGEQGPFSEPAQ